MRHICVFYMAHAFACFYFLSAHIMRERLIGTAIIVASVSALFALAQNSMSIDTLHTDTSEQMLAHSRVMLRASTTRRAMCADDAASAMERIYMQGGYQWLVGVLLSLVGFTLGLTLAIANPVPLVRSPKFAKDVNEYAKESLL